jgi:hypothetical protein
MDASDVIKKNKVRAEWINYQQMAQLQVGCTVGCDLASSCVIRYPSYDFRNDIREGRAACICPSSITCYVTGLKTTT